MIKKTGIIACGAMVLSGTILCQNSFEQRIKKNFSAMEHQMQAMKKNIDETFSENWFKNDKKNKKTNAVHLVQKDIELVLQFLVGKNVKNFDADLEPNRLTITIPEKNLEIIIGYDKDNKYLSYATRQAAQEEKKENNSYQKYESRSTTQQGTTIDSILNFKKAHVEYKDKTLFVIVPKQIQKKKESKKLNVLIK
ncbi:hypothetical protein KAH94_00235 [bacterium]|nr:hypothetical protein [bacterium]